MIPPQLTPVTCPVCKGQFGAELHSIVDVSQDPRLKALLLQGRLNVAGCPHCGNAGFLGAPFLYHDPDKEMLLCFVPNSPAVQMDQQKIIGDLTNHLLNSLPPEKRKAYLLQPKIFLTLDGLIEAILQADGITKEMLEAQRAKVTLIEKLLAAPDDEHLRTLVEENKDALDYEFFQILTASMAAAHGEGRQREANQLANLRARLAELTGQSAEMPGETITREELLQHMIEAENDDRLEMLVAAGRPLMDYYFYQTLTDKIDAAGPDEAQRLRELRAKILDISSQQEEATKAALEKGAQLLKQILDSPDPKATVEEHLDEIDDALLAIISINIQQAEANGQREVAQTLSNLGNMILSVLQENAPPEIKLINQLLQAEYPEQTKRILEEQRELIAEELLQSMEIIAQDMEQRGRKELAQRLRDVKAQAEAIR